jgi:hypothetical protein
VATNNQPTATSTPAAPAEMPQAVNDLEEGRITLKSITMTDDNGNTRARIETGSDGVFAISLLDASGKERAAIYLDNAGNPVIYMADANGTAKTQYYIDPNGAPTLSYVDAGGQTKYIIPETGSAPPPSRPPATSAPTTRTRTPAADNPPPRDQANKPPRKQQTATVWVLRNFSNYHRKGCSRIQGKNAYAMSVAEAKQRGFRPCPECRPMH